MKIHKDCKIEKATSKDVSRYVLTEPYLDVENKAMVATNGVIIAVVPVELSESDKSGHITAENLQSIRKTRNCSAECGDDWIETDNSKIVRSNLGNFKNWKIVIPPLDRETKFQIGLNIKLLWELCQAIGCETARLEFSDDLSAVFVRPTSVGSVNHPSKPAANPDAYGVIMPTRLA